MVFVSCLYLNQNRSYGQKGVLDIFGDLDLDLDLSIIKLYRIKGHNCVYYWVKDDKSNRNIDAGGDD